MERRFLIVSHLFFSPLEKEEGFVYVLIVVGRIDAMSAMFDHSITNRSTLTVSAVSGPYFSLK